MAVRPKTVCGTARSVEFTALGLSPRPTAALQAKKTATGAGRLTELREFLCQLVDLKPRRIRREADGDGATLLIDPQSVQQT